MAVTLDRSAPHPTAPASLGTAFLVTEIALVAVFLSAGGGIGTVLAIMVIIGLAAFWTMATSATTREADSRLIAFLKTARRQFNDWGLWRKPTGRDILWTTLALVSLGAAAEAYNMLFVGSGVVDSVTAGRDTTITGTHGLLLQVATLAYGLVAGPLLEEIGWRGYMLGGSKALLCRVGIPSWAAAILALAGSSVLFGLSHWQYDIHDQMLMAITGVAYGLVFLKTRNIVLSASLHAAWNLVWVLSVFLN